MYTVIPQEVWDLLNKKTQEDINNVISNFKMHMQQMELQGMRFGNYERTNTRHHHSILIVPQASSRHLLNVCVTLADLVQLQSENLKGKVAVNELETLKTSIAHIKKVIE